MGDNLRPVRIDQIFTEIIDSFSAMCVGFASLHFPEVQRLLSSIPIDKSIFAIGSSFPGENLNLSIKLVVDQVRREQQQPEQELAKITFATITRIFVILAWNLFEEGGLRDRFWKQPIVQFFYHIRNGCAHNNKFFFKGKKQLTLLAEWRGKLIDTSLEGKPVVNEFFKEGDFAHLLEDLSKLK